MKLRRNLLPLERLSFVLLSLSMVLSLEVPTTGQSISSSWQAVESKNREVQFLVPPGGIFVNEDGESSVYATGDGLTALASTRPVGNASDYVSNISFPASSGELKSIKLGKALVRQLTFTSERVQSTHLYIATPKQYYEVSAHVKPENSDLLKRFLAAVKVSGRYLTGEPSAGNAVSTGSIVLENQRSSPIVSEYLNRPDSEPTRVSLGAVELVKANPAIEYSRRLILLRKPKVDLSHLPRQPGKRIRARATLLKSGGVGEIIVEPELGRDYALAVARAVVGIRFIPAEVNGQPVDSVRVFEYSLI